MPSRLVESTPELDAAELAWWTENGDLEERFCWVQTPQVRRVLRRPYLRDLLAEVPSGGRILEVGCGTGWLSVLLAERDAVVTAIDGSASQIERARATVDAEGCGDRVELLVASPGQLAAAGRRFDAVVMHAFLHHLTTSEVADALDEAASVLEPGGRLVVVEPVCFPGGSSVEPRSLRALRLLQSLPTVLSARRLRRMSAPEREARARLDRRWAGTGPRGPAPKEMPFESAELRELLEGRFHIERWSRPMAMAHLVAQEQLLAGLSQPRLWRAALPGTLRLARWLDRRLLRGDSLPCSIWALEAYVCARREQP